MRGTQIVTDAVMRGSHIITSPSSRDSSAETVGTVPQPWGRPPPVQAPTNSENWLPPKDVAAAD